MDLHLPIDRSAGRLTAQVAASLRESIRAGALAAGARLPATRALADDLGTSRGVIVEAYAQLVAEGFLESRTGFGTVVSAACSQAQPALAPQAGQPRPTPEYDLRQGIPDLRLFPRDRWLACLREVLATLPHEALSYPEIAGAQVLRQELSDYLNRVRATQAAPDRIVITLGVAQGLSLVMRALVARGVTRLAVEDPTGLQHRPLLLEAGMELIPVPVDAEGIDVGRLAASGVRAAMLTPAHQYPLGMVLSPQRRLELAEWADATGAIVLEDDYDAEFRFDREPVGSLQGLAPDRVVLAGSVSKSLSPALRLGWLVAPPDLAAEITRLRARTDLGSPTLDQHTLARFISSGGFDRHLRKSRRVYRARRDTVIKALAAHLPEARVLGISAGLHLYAELPAGWDDAEIARRALELGVDVVPASPMRLRPPAADGLPGLPGLVLGFSLESPDRLVRAIALLASVCPRASRNPAGFP